MSHEDFWSPDAYRAQAAQAAIWAALLTAPSSGATSLDVRPVRLEIDSPAEIGTLTFSNRGSQMVTLQARAVAWQQIDGETRFERTDDLIVSPPFFSLAPGADQVVRVGLRRAVAPDVESSYRIFFTELPRPRQSTGAGLKVNLSLAIPVFVAPDQKEEPPVEWSFAELGDDRLELRVRNPGNRRLQVKEVRLRGPSGRELGVLGGPGYVLAGRERRWVLELADALPAEVEDGLVVLAQTDRGPQVSEARRHLP